VLVKLTECLAIVAGPNSSRIKDKVDSSLLYSSSFIEEDLSLADGKAPVFGRESNSPLVVSGDLVIFMNRGAPKATIISSKHAGKMITSNFVKCIVDEGKLDRWFLAYWINESAEVKRQNHVDAGMALYSPSAIGNLEIQPPNIKIQRQIGALYREMCRQLYLFDRNKESWKRLVLGSISNELNKGK
jgi:hypothetical protein